MRRRPESRDRAAHRASLGAGAAASLAWSRRVAASALLCVIACTDSSSVPTTGPTHFVLAAAGALAQSSGASGSSCLITLFSGTVYCWGDNHWGTFGNGSSEDADVPVLAGGGMTFASVSLGEFTACGIVTPSRALYCWGFYGDNLADDPLPLHLTPILLDGSHKFRMVSEGTASGCALTVDDAAYCWGEDADGELGDGNNSASATPIAVVGGHAFQSIGVGIGYACALTAQGEAYCWGDNEVGNLGTGSTDERNSNIPELVTGQHHFTSMSVGAFHTCALTQSGEAFCWGHDGFNELGSGMPRDDDPHPTPERVAGNLAFSVLGAGGGSSCAVTTRGVAYCWGSNFGGQLGNGTTDDSNTPVAVAGGLTFVSIQSGNGSSCGIVSNGDVYCWGENGSGELGTGDLANSLVPVKTHFSP